MTPTFVKLETLAGRSLTYKDNDELNILARNGDENAKDRMICGNMALVVTTVNSFTKLYPQYEHLRDDLVSVGFLELTESVERLSTLTDVAKPTGYICRSIRNALISFIANEDQINVPRKSRQRDPTITVPKQTAGDPTEVLESQTYIANPILDLYDQIESCAMCDNEKIIIRMRSEGYTDDEISETTGIPRRTVASMRATLYDRFLEKSGMERR